MSQILKGSEVRQANYPIDSLFIDRWSPRAMTGEAMTQAELRVLFEAARWAPSSYNEQPWRILHARRDTEQWQTFFDLLVEGNQRWAAKAGALMLFISKKTSTRNGKPSITHSFDTGAAWENMALQGFLKGYVVHGMQGFDYERAKTALNIPDDFRVEAMVAAGKPQDRSEMPEEVRERETPNSRRSIEDTVCEGAFCF
ncbi:MAG TPA: nitroreductase family protein [Gammaproteobacteria bacterium]|nr:nitroreductase family protein [Gammaproteobacteria bacterium]